LELGDPRAAATNRQRNRLLERRLSNDSGVGLEYGAFFDDLVALWFPHFRTSSGATWCLGWEDGRFFWGGVSFGKK